MAYTLGNYGNTQANPNDRYASMADFFEATKVNGSNALPAAAWNAIAANPSAYVQDPSIGNTAMGTSAGWWDKFTNSPAYQQNVANYETLKNTFGANNNTKALDALEANPNAYLTPNAWDSGIDWKGVGNNAQMGLGFAKDILGMQATRQGIKNAKTLRDQMNEDRERNIQTFQGNVEKTKAKQYANLGYNTMDAYSKAQQDALDMTNRVRA